MVKEVIGKFIEKIYRTPTIYSFRFALNEKVNFIAGQFMEVILDKKKEMRHYLSFSCAPIHNYIEFTKRISQSEFSQKLVKLKKDDEVLFRLPFGNCILTPKDKNISFIVGGIGITPAISIIEYVSYKKQNVDIFLLYSNRLKEEIAFKEELDNFKKFINLRIIYLVNNVDNMESLDNDLKKGDITKETLNSYKEDLVFRKNFIFGPPKMVEFVIPTLKDLGIKNIVWEKFIGY